MGWCAPQTTHSSLSSILFLVGIILITLFHLSLAAYSVGQEGDYLSNFNTLISTSYSAPRPSSLSQCINAGQVTNPLQSVQITSNMDAVTFQNTCGTSRLCIINPGVTVTINANINVAAIINRGTITWTDSTQTQTQQFICAGYLVTEANGIFSLSLSNKVKSAFIYIKDNGARHSEVGYRVFGGTQTGATISGYPRVDVAGSPVARTWTVLSTTARSGDTSIKVAHDVISMGWAVGDRIVIATTAKHSKGDGQGGFFIKSISGNRIHLATDSSLSTNAVLNQEYLGNVQDHMQAEVMLMSRNVIVTGDDFKQVPCGEGTLCPCRFAGEVCTAGLHTIMNGNDKRYGGTYRIQHTRVEKCGQRGVIGRYCIHFHTVRDCENCLAHGNAVEYSHQRGIVIHDTHMSVVSHNTLYDVRGAGIYIEDGNELFNYVEYNSVVCPHSFEGNKHGCTIPGTDNGEADTNLNQAAYWSMSHTNHFIGNRASNSYNGLFFHPSFAPGGRGFASGKVCASFLPLGRVQGNTCHGHGRFGTYFVSSDWPRNIKTNLSVNGYTFYNNNEECAPWDNNGFDRGLPSSIYDNIDYHNVFVGSYALGDIQFRNHVAKASNNLIYHKETKNFRDGCSAHFKNYHLEDGAALLASGLGTQLFEDVVFKGQFSFESNHHCSEGVTGVLCNPQYMFINPTWEVTSSKFLTWNEGNNPTRGSTYSLSPPDALNPKSKMFPPGFQSVCHGMHTYLLALDNGQTCVTSQSLGLGNQYENGIFCRKPLRRLEVFTQGLTVATKGSLKLRVSKNGAVIATPEMPFMVIPADTHKQGFTMPVVASLDYDYRLLRDGGVPAGWIIEFSDPVIGNRWAPDQIRLQADGRTCPTITTSQHDRRYIWASSDDSLRVPGRGACSSFPDMPVVNCAQVPEIGMMTCPELCSGCNGANQYCDCGSAKCLCKPGFSGPGCTVDICASARCGPQGECTARFLGGNVPVTDGACRCKGSFVGPTCESNPCAGQTCNGHGICQPAGEKNFVCKCEAGYSGTTCDKTCNGFCQGSGGVWPYGCNNALGRPSFCQGGGGGCGYSNDLFNNNNWCCYAFCDACLGVTCPTTTDNDCTSPGTCVNGACTQSSPRAEGSVCHSRPYGTCRSGVCTSDGTTPAPTSAPVTNAPTTKPTSAPVTNAPTTKPTSAPVTNAPTTSPSCSVVGSGAGSGLSGSYFQGSEFNTYAATRIDPTLSFNWGTNIPLSPLAADYYSVEWTGQIEPRYSGLYTFTTNSDDSAQLWISDLLIIDHCCAGHAASDSSGTMTLVGGQKYNIRILYRELAGEAVFHFYWSHSCFARTIVPSSSLYPTGSGLTGKYYNNIDFTGSSVTRIDPIIEFNWALGAPIAGIDVETFSVRWTGKIVPSCDGAHTFYIRSDDGSRLWVNGVAVAQQWVDQAVNEVSGNINLQRGRLYDIVLEYYDSALDATMILSWSSACQSRVIIPQTRLFPL